MTREIRTIEVNGRLYRWTLRKGAISVSSVEGNFAVRYPLGNYGNHYIHVTGSELGGVEKPDLPSRYLNFHGFWEEIIITPRQVRELIEWCNAPLQRFAANPNHPQELIVAGQRYQWLVIPIKFNERPTLDFRSKDASIHLRQVLGQSEVLSLGERWTLYPSPQFRQGRGIVVLREDALRLLAWWNEERSEVSAHYPAAWPPGFRRFERSFVGEQAQQRAEAQGWALDVGETLHEFWQIAIFDRTVRTQRGLVGGSVLESDTKQHETKSQAKRAAGIAIEEALCGAEERSRFREIPPEVALKRMRRRRA